MASLPPSLLSLATLFSFWALISFRFAHSLSCNSQKFNNSDPYASCLELAGLGSTLHYSYDTRTSSLSIAYSAHEIKSNGWIGWGVNLNGTGMVGAHALIAFKKPEDGSTIVKTYNLASYSEILEGKIPLTVSDLKGESENEVTRIFAKIQLPSNSKNLNQVWQVGPMTKGAVGKHEMRPANRHSKGSLNLVGKQTTSSGGGGGSRLKKKNIHGILNALSWGILFPVGAIIARYLRVFESADPAWFYAHVACQFSAYVLGVAGWGTGLKLGSESVGIRYSLHRNIGISLFALATLQIFALFLRPKKEHKYRPYWNVYHYGLGYLILILGIINVFKGLNILQPQNKWKTAYIIVLAVLGGIAVLLEAVTWIIVLRKKSRKSTKPYDGYNG